MSSVPFRVYSLLTVVTTLLKLYFTQFVENITMAADAELRQFRHVAAFDTVHQTIPFNSLRSRRPIGDIMLELFRMLCVRLPLPIRQFSSRFNSRSIISARREVRRCGLVLKLRSIVEMSVVSENDGITVRQTAVHTIQLSRYGLGTPCGSSL